MGELARDESLALNNDRVQARDRIMPVVRALFGALPLAEALAQCEAIGLPVAPIARPEDLFNDAHLNAAGGLVDIVLPDGTRTCLPALPVEIDGERMGVRHSLGAPGSDSRAVLARVGLDAAAIDALFASGAAA
jgi:crotonobetainyl-CoA:carnitine CoA-transferase CaiB-like acyl-CoA transferase